MCDVMCHHSQRRLLELCDLGRLVERATATAYSPSPSKRVGGTPLRSRGRSHLSAVQKKGLGRLMRALSAHISPAAHFDPQRVKVREALPAKLAKGSMQSRGDARAEQL